VHGPGLRVSTAADKPLTEQMLLRAQALDPKPRWSSALGRLYAFILVGSNSSTPLNVVRTVSKADANSPYAREIRKKLADSKDADLLTAAGQYLTYARGRDTDFDPVELGKSCLERALGLNPNSTQVRGRLVGLRFGERNRRMHEILRNVPKESQYQTVSALPESERFVYLPQLAELAYFEGENADYYNHDKAATEAAWNRATRYAQGLKAKTELDVTLDDIGIRLVRTGPEPRLVRRGRRLIAKPATKPKDLPDVDLAALVEEERNRWPW